MNKLAFLLALLALAVLGSGTATAAKLLTGKDVRNGSLTGADLKNGSVGAADLAPKARPRVGRAGPAGPRGAKGATGAQGAPGADTGFTRAQADARFQGRGAAAADANLLDGTDRDDLVTGTGAIEWGAATRAFGTVTVTMMDLGDLGRIAVRCEGNGNKTVTVINDHPTAGASVSTGQRTAGAGPVTANVTVLAEDSEVVATGTASYQLTLSAYRTGATQELVTLVLTATDDGASSCRFMAHTIANRS